MCRWKGCSQWKIDIFFFQSPSLTIKSSQSGQHVPLVCAESEYWYDGLNNKGNSLTAERDNFSAIKLFLKSVKVLCDCSVSWEVLFSHLTKGELTDLSVTLIPYTRGRSHPSLDLIWREEVPDSDTQRDILSKWDERRERGNPSGHHDRYVLNSPLSAPVNHREMTASSLQRSAAQGTHLLCGA